MGDIFAAHRLKIQKPRLWQ